ncbi:hypothetical protein DFS34DRAFT_402848 [Phlyctochytrium arcticum]|nr:hypothetical protein DFS34DRAFT_654976 [Phlyctochytrium arcticum]KAI9102629.1 hypothetical protein DFS34DRAFT_402848 [Phlyctochytrium arcticum]
MGRKQTTQTQLTTLPTPTDTQLIAKVLEPRGGSFLVALPSKETILVILPKKFQKVIWVKRGNFVIIDRFDLTATKIEGEIAQVLFTDHIKYLRSLNIWPTEFDDKDIETNGDSDADEREEEWDPMNPPYEGSESEEEEEEEGDLLGNTGMTVAETDNAEENDERNLEGSPGSQVDASRATTTLDSIPNTR